MFQLSPTRPAYLHIKLEYGEIALITQLYDDDGDDGDDYLHNDPVHAVHPDLIVQFKPWSGDCNFEATFGFMLDVDATPDLSSHITYSDAGLDSSRATNLE